MANPEESSPLLNHPDNLESFPSPADEPKSKPVPAPAPAPAKAAPPTLAPPKIADEWTADGLPLSDGSVVGEPLSRAQWDSSLFACLGRNDEFCGSDLEVCILGSFAPCVLHGSNVERLRSVPGSFASSCLPYAFLYMLGNAVFGGNCLAPWLSYPSRTAIRRRFNLEGSFEAFSRSFGCCSGLADDAERREQIESACDLATHYFCHPCSLCQEGRELRRRLPHPGFRGRSLVVMMPPAQQTMGRGGM